MHGKGGVVADPLDVVAYFAVRGKATVDKAGEMLELTHAMLADANLDDGQAKVVEILRETQSRLETAFISSGQVFAGARLAARNSLLGYIGEATQGVTYYGEVKAMLAMAQDDWPTLLGRLRALRDTLLSQEGVVINLTADPDAIDAVTPAVDGFVAKLPPTAARAPGAAPWAEEVSLLPREDEAYAITTQVHYVAAGCQLFKPGEEADGAFYTVARFLSQGFLWDNVRVVGGAYGGGCSLNPVSGGFAFSSYRDPNVQGTLDTYARSADALTEAISDEALEQAIVGAMGDLDSPMTSEQKGYRSLIHHLTGVTTESRQKYRDQVLGTSREAFAAFAERLRATPLKVAIFGSKEALEKANEARGEDEQITIKQLS